MSIITVKKCKNLDRRVPLEYRIEHQTYYEHSERKLWTIRFLNYLAKS